MLRERQNLWRRLNLLGDLMLTAASLLGAVYLLQPGPDTRTVGLMTILTVLFWAIFLYGPDGSYFYRLKPAGRVLRELYLALFKSFLAFTAVVYFVQIPWTSPTVLAFFAADTLLLTLFRLGLFGFLSYYRTRGRSNRNALIIGTGPRARRIAESICDSRHRGIHLLGFLDYRRTGLWRFRDIPLLGHPDGLAEIIANNQVDYLIMAVESPDLPLTAHAFTVAEEMGVTVCSLSDIYFHPISRASNGTFLGFPSVIYSSEPAAAAQLTVKSLIDRIGGIIGVIVSIPVALVSALAIKLEDGGPVFFRQVRSGKNGKPFTIYKFRTMVRNADKLKDSLVDKNEMSGPVFKIKKDPRITRVGAMLRKLSIDELPQFLNVVKGDMSLVGPRPPLPNEVARYDLWQRRKLSVKPGLTCLWQVNGRNHVDFEDWMKLDLEYIDNWSLWLDTKILLKTVPAVLKGDGAS